MPPLPCARYLGPVVKTRLAPAVQDETGKPSSLAIGEAERAGDGAHGTFLEKSRREISGETPKV